MIKIMGQFGLRYSDQAHGTLESLVATSSLLSIVIEAQGKDIEIASIKDRVRLGTVDKG